MTGPQLPKVYSRDPTSTDAWVRSLAGAVPWVGSAIGELLTRRWTRLREERLEQAFAEVSRQIGELGETKLDKEYVHSDGFLHILTICVESILREHDDRKRQFFVNLLINAMTKATLDQRSRAEWFASVLGRMSSFHLIGLSLVFATPEQRSHVMKELDGQHGDFRAIAACLKDLESAGFIRDLPAPRAGTPDRAAVLDIVQKARLTESGTEYVRWLRSPVEAPSANQATFR